METNIDLPSTDEQKQLTDAVRHFTGKGYGLEARKKVMYSSEGVSQVYWDVVAELGLTVSLMPEAQDGSDGHAMDLLVIMQELG